ncbi:MAG: hypothetical protein KAS66_14975 [Candidatus Omnitrophica bacterium]|nr:hypothetical protein [Candidatus Omnitrophota bacterium]
MMVKEKSNTKEEERLKGIALENLKQVQSWPDQMQSITISSASADTGMVISTRRRNNTKAKA